MVENTKPPGSITLKEIQQEPDAIRESLKQHGHFAAIAKKIVERKPKIIIITGSGTSYHAANTAMYFLHVFGKMDCYSIHPAEFQYFIRPILDPATVVVAISQSGESADTLAAATVASEKGALVVPIVNEAESTLAREFPETVILSKAGKETSVLATKTYTSQVAIVASVALEFGLASGKLSKEGYLANVRELNMIPDRIEVMRETVQADAKKIAKYLKFLDRAFVLGAGPDIATAMEGALKLAEGSRIVAQGYSANEFLHGPITLADRQSLAITLVPPVVDEQEKDFIKIIERVKQQGASVLAVTSRGEDLPESVDFRITIPKCPMEFNPLVSIVPIQYLVLEIALEKALDPDKPEWLTKVARI
ncbi:MAG: SIS domain-containing protein [Candidatus Lokiarchaeota archaeon]|nr:SIS domain-containing protein [Candidatus Lokiarchaeota archaeon]